MIETIVTFKPTKEQLVKFDLMVQALDKVRELMLETGLKAPEGYFELCRRLTKWRREYDLLCCVGVHQAREVFKGRSGLFLDRLNMRSKDMTIPRVGRVYFEPEMRGTPKRVVLIRESYSVWKAEVTIDETGPYQEHKNLKKIGNKSIRNCEMPFNFSLEDGEVKVTRLQHPNSVSGIFFRGRIAFFDNSKHWYRQVCTEKTLFFAYFYRDTPYEIKISSRPNLHQYLADLQTKNSDRRIELLGWKDGGRKTEKKFRNMFKDLQIRGYTFRRTLDIERFFMET